MGQIKPRFSFWLKTDFRKMTSNRNIQVKQNRKFCYKTTFAHKCRGFQIAHFWKKTQKNPEVRLIIIREWPKINLPILENVDNFPPGVLYSRKSCKNINPIQDGEGQKGPATSFSPVTSTNAGIIPQNFLTFSFNPFDRLVQNFKFAPSASPKLSNLNQDHPSKKVVFLDKSL